ncbi:tumor necrosis factor receptor superfamily member 6 [Stigmatopora argus]
MRRHYYSLTSLTYFFYIVTFGSGSSLDEVQMQESLLPKMKRDVQCADGVYQHGTITCCLCGVGQRLKEHCTAASSQDTQCERCEPGTYNSRANQDKSCKRCTSCSHENVGLEVETNCTRGGDTKCRCKANHYCIVANNKGCTMCSPCTWCGLEGVKVACNSSNDTVCNAKLERRTYAFTGVACALFALVVTALIWRNKKPKFSNGKSSVQIQSPATNEFEMEPIYILVGDPMQHVPAIVEVLGWKTMKDVAHKSGTNAIVIENCELDYPNDAQERTRRLLTIWVEGQGMGAMKTLVQILGDSNKYTAEKVSRILSSRV